MSRSLVVLIALLFTLYFVFRTTWVQSLVVNLAAEYLSRELKTEIRIGGLDISLRNGLTIQDIMVRDRNKGEIFSARELAVRISQLNLKKRILKVGKVYVDHGVFQLITYKGDSVPNINFMVDYFSSKDTTPSPPADTASKPWKISVSAVEVVETRFHLWDQNEPVRDPGMNFTDLDIGHINLLITDFVPDKDTMNVRIRHLSAMEKSGFTVRSMSGKFRVSPAFLKAEDLLLVTGNSDLDLSFQFLYNTWDDYSDFLTNVKIIAKIRPSYLDLSDIGAFAPELYVMKDKFQFSGDIKGTVSNFKAKNFRLAFGESTRFFGNISAYGLPDVEETFVDLDLKEVRTTKQDIESIRIPTDTKTIPLPDIIGKLGLTEVRGRFTGFYNDFMTNLKVTTAVGGATADLTLKSRKNGGGISYDGGVTVNNLQLGELLDSKEEIGSVTMKADLKGSGLTLDDADLKMNLFVDSVYLLGYNYHRIAVKGSLDEKKFNGDITLDDPNIDLDFNGLIDFSDSIPSFDFTSDIRHADLFRLQILARDSIQEIATRIKADFKGNRLDNIDGSIHIDSLVFQEGEKLITLNHLALFTSTDDKRNKSYELNSDFVDASFFGDFSFSQMLPSLVGFVENYIASFTLASQQENTFTPKDQILKYKITLKDTKELTNVFLPFLKVAPNTVFEGSYNEQEDKLSLDGHSPDIEVSGTHLEEWSIRAEADRNDLFIRTGCSRFFMGPPEKKDSSLIHLDTLNLASHIHRDTIHYDLTWLTNSNPNELEGFANFIDTPSIEIVFTKFKVMLDKKYWSLAKDNQIIIGDSSISLRDITFSSVSGELSLDGKISRNESDTLAASFRNLNISHLDYLLGTDDVDVDGVLNGNLRITNPYDGISVLSDLRIDSLYFNKEPLGEATFKVMYDHLKDRFDVNSKFMYTGNYGTNTPITLGGYILMNEKDPKLDFSVGLKNLNLVMVAPFVSDFMSGIHGLVSGDVTVTGHLSKPILKGELKVMRTELKISYLNVLYSLADVVKVDSNAFSFEKMAIFDSLGNKAWLTGKITHHNFSDLALDLSVDYDNFSAFNTNRRQNPVFFGNASASGNVRISGPVDDLNIRVNATTGPRTHVVIPIDLSSGVGQNDFIIFKEPKKDSLLQTRATMRPPAKGLSIDLALMVNPDADIEVYLPGQLGNLRASGTGSFSIGMKPTTGFSLLGSYTIEKGSFVFALRNLMRLPFTISQGSSISWAGDPADANVLISAVYKTRVPLQGVVSDASMASNRIPVECIIHLGGKLLNPDITFSLNLPNVENNIKSEVYANIDTTNQAVLSQQVLSILVMNQFIAVTGSGSNDVNVSPLSIVSNQLSSWLSGINQNVNLGVNYKAGTSTSGQEFDVAVSTQLLNNRLLIDGVFGMSYESTSSAQQASTIVGDINIEYVLTRNRRWRLKAFNRTNTTDNIMYNNAPYTQGVGVSWQRGFNRIGDIFKNEKKNAVKSADKNPDKTKNP